MDKINFFKKIGKTELSNLKKETVLKIINLNDYIDGGFIVDNIIKKIEKIDKKEIKIICDVRLSSIIDDFEKIKYKNKKKFESYTLYVYEDKNVIYLNKNVKELKKIKEIIKEIMKESYNINKTIELWNVKNELIISTNYEIIDEDLKDLKYKKIEKIIIKK